MKRVIQRHSDEAPLKVTFASIHDPEDISSWSGAEFSLLDTLEANGMQLDILGSIQRRRILVRKAMKRIRQIITPSAFYTVERTLSAADRIGNAIAARVAEHPSDLIFSPSSIPLSMTVTDVPMVFFTDATFGGLLSLYPELRNYSKDKIEEAEYLERAAIQNASRIIYTSRWAANSAINDYGAAPDRVRVVPFGSNLQTRYVRSRIIKNIQARSREHCELLMVGVDWERKGGDLAVEVCELLNERGVPTRLTVVGCVPPARVNSTHLQVYPFLDKEDSNEQKHMVQLYERSHFLLVPSMAECFGIVYVEASAMGLPSLARDSGGVTDAVRSGVNGEVFAHAAPASVYADHVEALFKDTMRYEALCLSAHEEHLDRLNWRTTGTTLRGIFEEVVRR